MDGLMQSRPLTIAHAFERAETLFADQRIISAGDGEMTYGDWAQRVRRLVAVLDDLGVPVGARVGTLAANHRRHLEVYAAVPVSKRVLHTLNIRLSTEHLEYIVGHAEDDVVFVDRGQLAQVWGSVDRLSTVRWWIVMPDGTDAALPDDPRILHHDEIVAAAEPARGSFEATFTSADENLASGLCYTSGTTGPPKGVLYSHRSTVLHCLGTMAAGYIGLNERDTVMPIVPMFHANAWGLPYAAMLAGADLVLPGRSADPQHLAALLQAENVTVSAAVPTVWTSLLPHLDGCDLPALRMLLGGGSAIAPSLSEAYRETVGVPVTHSWGMTEVSPVGVVGTLTSRHDDLAPEAQVEARAAQGHPLPLVNLRLVDVQSGEVQPWDGKSAGELQVSGPWVARSYYRTPSDGFTEDGWLRTGDLATLDQHGYLRLHDRIKDLIKSGGEWISSVELETALARHPDVAEVAVVGKPDPRWEERPVAFVVLTPGAGARTTSEQLLDHLAPLVAKWWLPEEITFLDTLPKTGTGKLSKVALRESFRTSATSR